MQTAITVTSPIDDTPRVQQIRGMFDLPEEKSSTVSWTVHLRIEDRPWNLGLIVGPSGSGKSTIARRLWPGHIHADKSLRWPPTAAILDAFPESMPIKDVVALLSSVGFSSPPAWLRPFAVLSTGQQFRVTLARLIAENPQLVVFDEFTSVVGRTVAQIGSAALAKTVRLRNQQFVAVTCHEDVEPWLDPDWVYRPAEQSFAWRALQRRPTVSIKVFRCHSSAWLLFQDHHYLSGHINKAAACFLATWQDRPVAFSAWLPFMSKGPPTRREHRTVTLPDYQGVGIGNALSDCIASMWQALGYRAISTTTHPAMIASSRRSPSWTVTSEAKFSAKDAGSVQHATTRLTTRFAFIGPALHPTEAKALYGR